MIKGYYISTEEREDMQFIGHPSELEFDDEPVLGIYKGHDGKYYARMRDHFFIELLVYDYIGDYNDADRNIERSYVLIDSDNEYHTGVFNHIHSCMFDCMTGEVLWEMEDARYHVDITWLAGRQVLVMPVIS